MSTTIFRAALAILVLAMLSLSHPCKLFSQDDTDKLIRSLIDRARAGGSKIMVHFIEEGLSIPKGQTISVPLSGGNPYEGGWITLQNPNNINPSQITKMPILSMFKVRNIRLIMDFYLFERESHYINLDGTHGWVPNKVGDFIDVKDAEDFSGLGWFIPVIREPTSRFSLGEELAPKDEDTIVEELASAKDDTKLITIKEFKPKVDELSGRFTLKPYSYEKGRQAWVVSRKTFGGSHLAYGFRGTMAFGNMIIDTEFSQDKFYEPTEHRGRGRYSRDDIIISGKGSIHRFNGEVERDGFKFVGEGEKKDRLTFVLLDKGYVYVRGKGKVIFPDGRKMKLGY